MTAQNETLMGLLTAALLPGEKARFEVAVASDGNVIATVLPVRQPAQTSDNTPEAARELIAALSMPIQVRAPAAEIDAEVMATLGSYKRQRHAVNDTLEALNEALAAGRAAAHGASTEGSGAKAVTPKAESASNAATAPAASPAPDYGTDNPAAL